LTSWPERTIVSEKMIEDDLSRVEESATKSTYKLGVIFERCEDKGEKRAPKFVPTPKPREEAFVSMFCGRVGHLDEFCFRRKRIEKRRFDYARNSYRVEFSNFVPHSYSRASPRTSSHVVSFLSWTQPSLI
jgi:hypothetical protein